MTVNFVWHIRSWRSRLWLLFTGDVDVKIEPGESRGVCVTLSVLNTKVALDDLMPGATGFSVENPGCPVLDFDRDGKPTLAAPTEYERILSKEQRR